MSHKAKNFIIRKDGPTKSRPWSADIVFDDGIVWNSWSYNFKTKRGIIAHCQSVSDMLPIIFK